MASTQLTRTATSGTNTKATFSAWVKKADANEQFLFYHFGSSANNFRIRFDPDTIGVQTLSSSSSVMHLNTSAKFRDPSAWYHIVVAIDSTQATDTNRAKIYVNGVQQTSLSATTYPPQNQNMHFNESATVYIGGQAGSNYFNGSMTHLHWIDGTAYDADDFGESDSVSGIWKPKTAPSVTYGNNGFFLKMENSGAMGTDSSGNSNTFTVSGTLTQNIDSPTNNFNTWNPLFKNTTTGIQSGGIGNGNTYLASTSSNSYYSFGSTLAFPGTGKFYCEIKVGQVGGEWSTGIAEVDSISTLLNSGSTDDFANNAKGYGYRNNGQKTGNSGSTASYGNSFTTNDIIQIAYNNGTLWFGKNGTWQNSATATEIANGTTTNSAHTGIDTTGNYLIMFGAYNDAYAYMNAGNGYFQTTAVASAGTAPSEGGIFEYDCPTAFQALCTKGINSF